ncbi:hypothetical protein, partial [Vibrio cholerae]|uniref:hypothetical protein n=3 Tax=Vibrio cholerae TaxID=666 RepID=UPI00050CFB9A
MRNTEPKHHQEWKEFEGLLRIVRVENKDAGWFQATCTLIDDTGEILDRDGLYYLDASHQWMEHFVEVCSGQLKLATVLEFSQYNRSDSLGVRPP